MKHRVPDDDVGTKQRYRPIPPNRCQEVCEYLDDKLKKGIIRPSHSDYASPIVLIRKKSGKLRMCVDYRLVNFRTRKDAYPLPRIEEFIHALQGARYFSVIDLQSVFNQVAMDERDIHKTAFTTPFGLFKFLRMPFGLCNAPSTFQRLMQQASHEDIFHVLLVYLDDIIIFSKTVEEHITRLENVFQKHHQYGLKIELKKCKFFQTKVTHLGHTISAEGIGTDPEKTSVVKDWPVLITVRELRSFLGLASYYHRFVKGFASKAAALHNVVGECSDSSKGKKGGRRSYSTSITAVWSPECDEAFRNLKESLCTAPVLGLANYALPFILEVDASSQGLGAVLSQDQDGKRKVILYASRGLRKTERNIQNHSSKKLVLLALKLAMTEKFRDCLLGSTVTVYTDNNPLTYINTKAKLPAIEQRLVSDMASFNCTIKYKPGIRNDNADGLSRMGPRLQEPREGESDVTNVLTISHELNPETLTFPDISTNDSDEVSDFLAKLLGGTTVKLVLRRNLAKLPITKSQALVSVTANVGVISNLPEYIPETLREMQVQDQVIGPVLRDFEADQKVPIERRKDLPRQSKLLLKHWHKMVLKNGILHKRIQDNVRGNRLQLLMPKGLQSKLIEEYHDQLGHQGVDRMDLLVRQKYFWPGLYNDIKEQLDSCTVAKMPYLKTKTPMGKVLATRPLEVLALDYTVLEPSSNGMENVLVMTDVFTKFSVAVPTKDQKASTVAQVLLNEWVFKYGIPLRIHSDQVRNFDSNLRAELCNLYGIVKSRTTPGYPQGNGQVERFNRTLHDLIHTLAEKKKRSWHEHIKEVVYTYNVTPHASTGMSLCYLMFGRDPRVPIDIALGVEEDGPENEWVASHQERLHRAFNQANQQLQTSAAAMKTLFDRKGRDDPLNVGQWVYLRKFTPGRAKFKMPGTTESSEWLASLGTTMCMKYHQLMHVAQTGQWTGQIWVCTAPPAVRQLHNILPSPQSQSLWSDASDESSTDSEELPTVEIHLPGRRTQPPTPSSSESDDDAEPVLRRHTTRDTAGVPPNHYGEPIPQEWY